MLQPWQQWADQYRTQTIPVIRILFRDARQGGAGHGTHISGKRSFVLLVGRQAHNLSTADEREVPDLGRTDVFLQKHALGVIHPIQPAQRIFDRLTHDGVNRAIRRTQGVLDDVGTRFLAHDAQGVQAVFYPKRPGDMNARLRAQLAGKIAIGFQPHRLTLRAQDGNPRLHQLFAPGRGVPVDGHGDQEIRPERFQGFEQERVFFAGPGWPRLRRTVMPVVAVQKTTHPGAGLLEYAHR